MKKFLMIWFGIALMGLAAGAVVSIFRMHNVIGGAITAVIFGAAAFRVWYMAGEPSTKPPTEVEG
jgi:hypothetical protein